MRNMTTPQRNLIFHKRHDIMSNVGTEWNAYVSKDLKIITLADGFFGAKIYKIPIEACEGVDGESILEAVVVYIKTNMAALDLEEMLRASGMIK